MRMGQLMINTKTYLSVIVRWFQWSVVVVGGSAVKKYSIPDREKMVYWQSVSEYVLNERQKYTTLNLLFTFPFKTFILNDIRGKTLECELGITIPREEGCHFFVIIFVCNKISTFVLNVPLFFRCVFLKANLDLMNPNTLSIGEESYFNGVTLLIWGKCMVWGVYDNLIAYTYKFILRV